jgi:hypothetical protein
LSLAFKLVADGSTSGAECTSAIDPDVAAANVARVRKLYSNSSCNIRIDISAASSAAAEDIAAAAHAEADAASSAAGGCSSGGESNLEPPFRRPNTAGTKPDLPSEGFFYHASRDDVKTAK